MNNKTSSIKIPGDILLSFLLLVCIQLLYIFNGLYLFPHIIGFFQFFHHTVLGQSYGYLIILAYICWAIHQPQWSLYDKLRVNPKTYLLQILQNTVYFFLVAHIITGGFVIIPIINESLCDHFWVSIDQYLSPIFSWAFPFIQYHAKCFSQMYLSCWGILGVAILYMALTQKHKYTKFKYSLLGLLCICIIINLCFPILGPIFTSFKDFPPELVKIKFGYGKFNNWNEILIKQYNGLIQSREKHAIGIMEGIALAPNYVSTILTFSLLTVRPYLSKKILGVTAIWYSFYFLAIIASGINYISAEIFSLLLGIGYFCLISKLSFAKKKSDAH